MRGRGTARDTGVSDLPLGSRDVAARTHIWVLALPSAQDAAEETFSPLWQHPNVCLQSWDFGFVSQVHQPVSHRRAWGGPSSPSPHVFCYLSQPPRASAQDKSFLSAGSTSHFFRRPQRAGKARSDTTCASAAASRKTPASRAPKETTSPACGN